MRFPGQFFLIETGLAYNWHRHYDPTTGRYTQADPLRFVDGPSVYAYVGGSPYMRTDRKGLWCSSRDGITMCSYGEDGPMFEVPTPVGFIDFDGSETFFHYYELPVAIGDTDPKCVLNSFINNPTPGSPKPATPEGTPNDARVAGMSNPVTSYLTTDLLTGDPIVVNMTGSDSLFSSGYVARIVSEDGYAITYGEGTNWKQSPLATTQLVQDMANYLVWGRPMESVVANCGCQN